MRTAKRKVKNVNSMGVPGVQAPVKVSEEVLTAASDVSVNIGGEFKDGAWVREFAKPEAKTAGFLVNVAILSEEGFEEVELTSPKKALEGAGAHVDVISPHVGKIKGWNKTNWGKQVRVDVALGNADPNEYDALVLPGGVMNPDKLRQSKEAISFIKRFINSGKPIAAICHGAQTLIETGMLEGRTMTSYPSLKTDLQNAGVNWVDKEMVHSGQFITSRKPSDLPAFNNELIYALSLYDH